MSSDSGFGDMPPFDYDRYRKSLKRKLDQSSSELEKRKEFRILMEQGSIAYYWEYLGWEKLKEFLNYEINYDAD